jgi:arylformamidase
MVPKARKILDLTQDLYAECPVYLGTELAKTRMEHYHLKHGFNSERLDMNVHTSTHLDVPYHFFNDGDAIDQVELECFQGRGVVIDLRNTNSQAVLKEHLEPYADKVKEDDIVLLYTGWSKKRGRTQEYVVDFPYIGESAAQWLKDKKIRCVCIDSLSAGGSPEGTGGPPHVILLGARIIIVEELYMDEQLLEEDEWYITAYPLKLRGFGGSPVRVVATVFE